MFLGLTFFLPFDSGLLGLVQLVEVWPSILEEEEKKNEKEEKAKQKKEEKANLTEQEAGEEDLALKERTGPTARQEEEMVLAKQHDQEQLCNISRTLAHWLCWHLHRLLARSVKSS